MFLTLEQLQERTKIASLKENGSELLVLKELWLDAANGYIFNMHLDETKLGYESAMQIIVQQIVESLSANNGVQNILAANSPFRQEKIGNYSYTLKSGADTIVANNRDEIEQGLTPIVTALLNKYRLNPTKFQVQSTHVFKQELTDLGFAFDNVLGF